MFREFEMGSIRRLAIMALVATGCATAAAADVMILRSAGPSAGRYKPGSRLGDTAAVTLKAGDRLVLLDEKGIRDLQGPRTVALGDPAVAARPLSLGDFGMNQRPVIGGTRGFAGAFNLIQVDTAEPQCMIDGWPVFAARADKAGSRAYVVSQTVGSEQARIAFAQGQDRAAWPTALLTPGGREERLSVRDEDGGSTMTLSVRRLTGRPNDNLEMATLLLAHGCERELLRRAKVE
jgi:hypothetical protein